MTIALIVIGYIAVMLLWGGVITVLMDRNSVQYDMVEELRPFSIAEGVLCGMTWPISIPLLGLAGIFWLISKKMRP